VCGARVWTDEMSDARGRKNRPAAGGSLLRGRRGTTERGGGSGGGDATRREGGVGPGSDRRVASRPRSGRSAPLFR
jgi:hypothetical protein